MEANFRASSFELSIKMHFRFAFLDFRFSNMCFIVVLRRRDNFMSSPFDFIHRNTLMSDHGEPLSGRIDQLCNIDGIIAGDSLSRVCSFFPFPFFNNPLLHHAMFGPFDCLCSGSVLSFLSFTLLTNFLTQMCPLRWSVTSTFFQQWIFSWI